MAMQSLLIILLVLAALLVAGVPISYAIGISSLAAILQTVPLEVSVLTAAQRIFVGMSKFSLTAIPFFVLAGNLMNQGGIAGRLVDFVLALFGKLPGALLVTNVGANALFGAISDKHHSKWGRRTPFIVVGTLIAAVMLIALSFVTGRSVRPPTGQAPRRDF